MTSQKRRSSFSSTCIQKQLGYSDTEYAMTQRIAQFYNGTCSENNRLHVLESNQPDTRRCFQALWKIKVPICDLESNGKKYYPSKTQAKIKSIATNRCNSIDYTIHSAALPSARIQLVLPSECFQFLLSSINSLQTQGCRSHQGCRYIFMYLTLIHQIGSRAPSFHANGLLFDLKLGTCERIEPYGCLQTVDSVDSFQKSITAQQSISHASRAHNTQKRQLVQLSNLILDSTLQLIFENIKTIPKLQYIPPCLTLPPIGPQRLQELELDFDRFRTTMKNVDNFGFCTAWVIWLLQLRLEVGRSNIQHHVKTALSSKARQQQLTEFIFIYATALCCCHI